MSVEYGPAFRTYPSNYIFVSKCIWYNFRKKPVETGVKKGRFWAKMTGWVVSRTRKGGISFAKCCISFRKGGICKNREIVDTPTFPLFGLYMWYVPGRIFFPKDEFYGFSLIQLPFVSVCIRAVCTYITYITFIFFLIILPRRIYNAVFFWRQYAKRIFFKKFWSDVPNVQDVLNPPMSTPSRYTRPHVLNAKTLGNPHVHTIARNV